MSVVNATSTLSRYMYVIDIIYNRGDVGFLDLRFSISCFCLIGRFFGLLGIFGLLPGNNRTLRFLFTLAYVWHFFNRLRILVCIIIQLKLNVVYYDDNNLKKKYHCDTGLLKER